MLYILDPTLFKKGKFKMKKVYAMVFILSFVFNYNVFSQFQSDTRLTFNPASKYKCQNNTCGIASIGNFVHVVWSDYRVPASNEQIFYKRSTDNGLTWGPDVQLTNVFSSATNPAIVAVGSILHLVWADVRTGNVKIFYMRSTDNGTTWGPNIQLSFGGNSPSRYPSIAVSDQIVHIAWQDERTGNYTIFYTSSSTAGETWQNERRLTNKFAGNSQFASICALGSIVHLVWSDDRNGNTEIYYKHSTDDGVSWTLDTRLTMDSNISGYPSVSCSDSVVYVVWQDSRSGWDVYGKGSFDGGLTWGEDTRLTNDPFNQFRPSIIASGSIVHVTWQDVRDGNWEIYYKRSLDRGSTWETDERLTNSEGDSFYPSVNVNGTAVDILWQDARNGNVEMYYKRNPTGNLSGISKISRDVPRSYFLSQNYPNPFNPETKINFSVPKLSNIKIVVYDNLGREMQTLVNEQLSPGTYSVTWNASNYPSGVYFYRLTTQDYTETKKMILIK